MVKVLEKGYVEELSRIDMRRWFPYTSRAKVSELTLSRLPKGGWELVWWTGPTEENVEEKWALKLPQVRQRTFLVPGVPAFFVVLSGKIYFHPF